MSHWVYLRKDGGMPVDVPRHEEGGTYALGGMDTAELNVTYNYSEVYAVIWDGKGLREMLDGQRAGDVASVLEQAVEKLGTRQYTRDYWAPTPGNAGYALSILLGWARENPDAIFEVS
jgi:hypothetical protein